MKRHKYLEKSFIRDRSVVLRKVADEFLLVPTQRKTQMNENIYALNEVAARIWELTDGQRRIKDIRDIIVDEFEISQERAEADIVDFLHRLKKIGMTREM